MYTQKPNINRSPDSNKGFRIQAVYILHKSIYRTSSLRAQPNILWSTTHLRGHRPIYKKLVPHAGRLSRAI